MMRWRHVRHALLGSPNDEARIGHRLWDKGLSEVRWIGEVLDSELIAMLERQNSVHPSHNPARFASLRHFVIPLKEDTAEVIAEEFSIGRIAGSTVAVAAKALDLT